MPAANCAPAETGTVAREPTCRNWLRVVELYAPVSEGAASGRKPVAAGAQVLGNRQLLAQALATASARH
jgi:hypothetical protein